MLTKSQIATLTINTLKGSEVISEEISDNGVAMIYCRRPNGTAVDYLEITPRGKLLMMEQVSK